MNSSLALFSIRMDMVFIEVASQPYRYYIHISLKLHDQIPCPRYIANFGIPSALTILALHPSIRLCQ